MKYNSRYQTGWTLPSTATVIASLALVVSIASAVASWKTYHREPIRDSEKLTSDVVRSVYSDFISITDQRIQHPLQSHLFELPENYGASVAQVKAAEAAGRATKADLTRLVLEERAVADRIFTMFEQAYFQWDHAKAFGDPNRATFLEEVLKYYTQKLLRNPRLLWYWSESGGKLYLHYEPKTQAYYKEQVDPKNFAMDAKGPH